VLDLATGVSMGARGTEELEAERFACDYARSLNATRRFLEPGADEDRVQELHIQTESHSINFLPLNPNHSDGLYLCLLLEPKYSLGLPSAIQSICQQFQQEGSFLDDSEAEQLYSYRV
jgi:hypothetical protein